MGAGKRIVFATFGSLGDVHPYIALARALRARGHRPLIATFDRFRGAVEAAAVEFAAMRPGADALGDETAIVRRLFDPVKGSEYLVRGLFMPHLRESYQDLDRVCRDADVLVTHPIAFAGPLVAEKRSLPWASTVLAPISLFSAIDPPYFDAAPWLMAVRRLGVRPYRAAFALARFIARRWERPLHAVRPSSKASIRRGSIWPSSRTGLPQRRQTGRPTPSSVASRATTARRRPRRPWPGSRHSLPPAHRPSCSASAPRQS